MTLILRRSTYWILNQSAIPTFLKRLQKVSGPRPSEVNPVPNTKSGHAATNALTLLTVVAKHSPALLKLHVGELSKLIASGETDGKKGAVAVEVALMALANVVRWDEKLAAGLDKKTNERIVKLALGLDWRQAKFAARYLAFSKNKADLSSKVVEVRLSYSRAIA